MQHKTALPHHVERISPSIYTALHSIKLNQIEMTQLNNYAWHFTTTLTFALTHSLTSVDCYYFALKGRVHHSNRSAGGEEEEEESEKMRDKSELEERERDRERETERERESMPDWLRWERTERSDEGVTRVSCNSLFPSISSNPQLNRPQTINLCLNCLLSLPIISIIVICASSSSPYLSLPPLYTPLLLFLLFIPFFNASV